ncbi:hypothetical protein FMEAI12_3650027 [Parafrankia sp. Ea1.12]|nr:hypothetical protein FMEAI12_3650027 [Parafrankia sp. Ea1.12]
MSGYCRQMVSGADSPPGESRQPPVGKLPVPARGGSYCARRRLSAHAGALPVDRPGGIEMRRPFRADMSPHLAGLRAPASRQTPFVAVPGGTAPVTSQATSVPVEISCETFLLAGCGPYVLFVEQKDGECCPNRGI